jgi:hypothetical protein
MLGAPGRNGGGKRLPGPGPSPRSTTPPCSEVFHESGFEVRTRSSQGVVTCG